MRIMHLADLHLGKYLHNMSLIESGDQPYWINQLLDCAAKEKPDVILIAGDVYDRGVPAREAVPLLGHLLTQLSALHIPVLLTAGNHDGAERLEFASQLLKLSGVYVSGTLQRELQHITYDVNDGFGPVTFWLMPYVFPALIRQVLELSEEKAPTLTDCVRQLLAAQPIDPSVRNVLIAHQTVMHMGAEPEHSLSETSIGGTSIIDSTVFSVFDYVALGHIHGAQPAGSQRIRYAGSPLCYHFSEADQKKGPLLVTLADKNSPLTLETITLEPLHRVRPTMVGSLEDIRLAEQQSSAEHEYIRVVLTDEWLPSDTHDQLKALFESHNCTLLDLSREPLHTRTVKCPAPDNTDTEELSLQDHFLSFYRKQTGTDDPEPQDIQLINYLANQITEGIQRSEEETVAALVQHVLNQEVC